MRWVLGRAGNTVTKAPKPCCGCVCRGIRKSHRLANNWRGRQELEGSYGSGGRRKQVVGVGDIWRENTQICDGGRIEEGSGAGGEVEGGPVGIGSRQDSLP